MIRVLFIGDIVGFAGYNYVRENLATIKEQYNYDFLIVNGENICDGKGITQYEADVLFELGASVITTGNHI
jgi:hypothetical protein